MPFSFLRYGKLTEPKVKLGPDTCPKEEGTLGTSVAPPRRPPEVLSESHWESMSRPSFRGHATYTTDALTPVPRV